MQFPSFYPPGVATHSQAVTHASYATPTAPTSASLSQPPSTQVVPPATSAPPVAASNDVQLVYRQLQRVLDPEQREQAILELTKQRDHVPDLGVLLWYSVGTMAVLLQEVVGAYPLLSPPIMPSTTSTHISNALTLLQCVASHAETRQHFLDAQMALFLYPFLRITSADRPYEFLRLTSLGVIGALVKTDDANVITYLLKTEIVPLCLKIMERGSELSKTVATFIIQKILLSNPGLQYICQTQQRFQVVVQVLQEMVKKEQHTQCSPRLLRHIIRCYLRLSENPNARDALREHFPKELRDGTYIQHIQDDGAMKRAYFQVIENIGIGQPNSANGTSTSDTATPPVQPTS